MVGPQEIHPEGCFQGRGDDLGQKPRRGAQRDLYSPDETKEGELFNKRAIVFRIRFFYINTQILENE